MSQPDPSDPLAALRGLLAEYDRANRLQIDSLYAQLSPTLDDFYDESLRIDFPSAGDPTKADVVDLVRPDLTLIRVVPGLEPRRVHAAGTPFPLGRALVLWREALSLASGDEALALGARLASGRSWLRPERVGRSQTVHLVIEPDQEDALEQLSRLLGRPG